MQFWRYWQRALQEQLWDFLDVEFLEIPSIMSDRQFQRSGQDSNDKHTTPLVHAKMAPSAGSCLLLKYSDDLIMAYKVKN